jgi:bifunctional non-homologous end joining protein LigD
MSKSQDSALLPMLCSLPKSADEAARMLVAKGWIYELKLDGVRIVAEKEGPRVRLLYRKARDTTASYPEVAEAVAALQEGSVVLDGEVVAFDERGRTSFGMIQRRIPFSRPRDVALARAEVPVAYVVFDVLSVDGRDVRDEPLVERKKLLASIVPSKGLVTRMDHLEDDGRPLFALCEKEGLEGVVAKRRVSKYRPGTRSPDWVKLKCAAEDDFVVVGWTRGEGTRDRLGAIDVASYDGRELVIRGKVGSGFDERSLELVRGRLAGKEIPACAAKGALERAPRGRVFVEPEVVVSVKHHGWTGEGRLRAPVFRGVREDVDPADCVARPD